MAKQIGIEIDIDVDGKPLKQLIKDIDNSTKSLGNLEERSELLKEALKGVEVGSKEFKKLASEISKTDAEIKDLELSFEALDMEQRFTAGADALGGVAGGFSAVQGAMAIAGSESAAFEETMLRIQGAMALAMGIKDISTAIVSIKKLGGVMGILNKVISANPLVLILTGAIAVIGTVIAAMGKLEAVTQGVGDAVNWVGRQLGLLPSKAEEASKAQQKASEEAGRVYRAEERKKTQAVLDAEKEKMQARTESFDFEIAKLQASGQATFDVEQEKLGYVIESLNKQKEILNEQIAFEQSILDKKAGNESKFFGKSIDSEAIIARARLKNRKKQLEETEKEETKAAQTRELNQIKEDKRIRDEQRKAWEELQKQKAEQAKIEEEEERKRLERLAKIREAFEDEIAERTKAKRIERKQEEADENEEFYALLAQQRADADARLEEQRQEDLEKEKAIAEAKQLLQDSVVKGAEALTSLLIKDAEKAEKVQKAIALAQIAIDTAKAISSLTANSEANPLNSVTGGLAGIAQFAGGIARILANVAQAAALLKAPSPTAGLSGSSSGGGTASAGVPINAVQNGSTLNPQGNNGQQTNQVVVVESDITQTQGTISSITEQATVVEQLQIT